MSKEKMSNDPSVGDAAPRRRATTADIFRILRQRALAGADSSAVLPHQQDDFGSKNDAADVAFLAAALGRPEPLVASALEDLAHHKGSAKPV